MGARSQRQGGEPWPLCRVPAGRGRGAAPAVRGDPVPLSPACGHRPHQHERAEDAALERRAGEVRLVGGKHRVSAPSASTIVPVLTFRSCASRCSCTRSNSRRPRSCRSEKATELGRTMARHALADDRAGFHVQRGEDCGDGGLVGRNPSCRRPPERGPTTPPRAESGASSLRASTQEELCRKNYNIHCYDAGGASKPGRTPSVPSKATLSKGPGELTAQRNVLSNPFDSTFGSDMDNSEVRGAAGGRVSATAAREDRMMGPDRSGARVLSQCQRRFQCR